MTHLGRQEGAAGLARFGIFRGQGRSCFVLRGTLLSISLPLLLLSFSAAAAAALRWATAAAPGWLAAAAAAANGT